MDEEIKDSPNGLNQDKFLDRIRNVIEVARIEEDLSALEVIGALEVAKLEVFGSLEGKEDGQIWSEK